MITLDKILSKLPKKYHEVVDRIDETMPNAIIVFAEPYNHNSLYGEWVAVYSINDAVTIIKEVYNIERGLDPIKLMRKEAYLGFQGTYRNIWVVREVDIEDVAYADKYFKTQKEAMDYIREYRKSSHVVDILIKTPFHYTESLIEELRESESNRMFTDYNATIIHRR